MSRPIAQPIGYSPHERPPGQPGEVRHTRERITQPDGKHMGGQYVERRATFGLTYPAVLEPNGDLWIWRDSEKSAAGWIKANGYISRFEPGPEWQANCHHQHVLPWRPCDTEGQCNELAHEEVKDQ